MEIIMHNFYEYLRVTGCGQLSVAGNKKQAKSITLSMLVIRTWLWGRPGDMALK